MAYSRFFIVMMIATIVASLLFYGLSYAIPMLVFSDLFWWSVALFIVLSFIIFIASKWQIRRGTKGAFVSVVLFNVILKLILCFGLVYAYVQDNNPLSKWFIVPFLISYVVFTIAETYALTRVSAE